MPHDPEPFDRSPLDSIGARVWLIVALAGALLFAPSGPLAPSTRGEHVSTRPGNRPTRPVIGGSQVGIDEAYNPLWESNAALNADFDAIKASGAQWVSFDFDS